MQGILYELIKNQPLESDVCRLIWVLRKQQPTRSDVFTFEEILFVAELDVSIRSFFEAFQGVVSLQAAQDTPGASDCGGLGSEPSDGRSGISTDPSEVNSRIALEIERKFLWDGVGSPENEKTNLNYKKQFR